MEDFAKALDNVAPFAALVDADGACGHIGRSLEKSCDISDGPQNFFDLFRISKPFLVRGCTDLRETLGKPVVLQARRKIENMRIEFRASIALLNPQEGVYLILTSLGLDLPVLI